jgi:hypothetical protein
MTLLQTLVARAPFGKTPQGKALAGESRQVENPAESGD